MSKPTNSWFLAGKSLREDFPFFCGFGLLCGIVQWISYHFFSDADFGTNLLQEHIAFYTIAVSILFLLVAKFFSERSHIERPKLKKLIAHVSGRTEAFASVAFAVICGFAFSALLFLEWIYTLKFLWFSIYFLAFAEIAANPVRMGRSKMFFPALGIIIGLPIATMLWG
jgi:hypothetical protein